MDADELVLLEALVAVLPYVFVKTGDWLGRTVNRVQLRRAGADAL